MGKGMVIGIPKSIKISEIAFFIYRKVSIIGINKW
jgi:hypothetical protein